MKLHLFNQKFDSVFYFFFLQQEPLLLPQPWPDLLVLVLVLVVAGVVVLVGVTVAPPVGVVLWPAPVVLACAPLFLQQAFPWPCLQALVPCPAHSFFTATVVSVFEVVVAVAVAPTAGCSWLLVVVVWACAAMPKPNTNAAMKNIFFIFISVTNSNTNIRLNHLKVAIMVSPPTVFWSNFTFI